MTNFWMLGITNNGQNLLFPCLTIYIFTRFFRAKMTKAEHFMPYSQALIDTIFLFKNVILPVGLGARQALLFRPEFGNKEKNTVINQYKGSE